MLSMANGIKVGSEVRGLRGKFSIQKGVVQTSGRRTLEMHSKCEGRLFFGVTVAPPIDTPNQV